MVVKKITMFVAYPNDVSEQEIDEKLADCIFDIGGEVIDILSHEKDNSRKASRIIKKLKKEK